MKDPRPLIRPLVHGLHAYVPGEQPKIRGLIKLNTNENPYPPSPGVLKAVKAAVDGRLRLYPDPAARALREKLARVHGCKAENIIVGNGSDELLALATRAFVEPAADRGLAGRSVSVRREAHESIGAFVAGEAAAARSAAVRSRATVQYFTPGYSLYPVLADIHGAARKPVPLKPDFGMPTVKELRRGNQWDFKAALTYVTTPNAPGGRGYPTVELEALCRTQKGVVILDEAYVDFADENALELALKYPHVIVSRTFSKAYSLCFQRVGYCVGHSELIAALDKIRDSYNVNGLGQVAALATLDDLPYYRRNFQRIVSGRERVARELTIRGFRVFPSQTNFLLVQAPAFAAKEWLRKLRGRKVLVRWFDHPEVRDCLRITIGSEIEMRALLRAVKSILNGP
ncbi:MAG TPA: aminotransferase class I/II-fold pyridoxal phosphate-dependent enzyme [Verrucomicrobiae bacterium]|nr:aminotransferase class I/II-fold pyridoxal phosphate-dependent enzyme [Verrucomicrobiae bacterium]